MKEIPLTQGKVALVDDADFEAVNQFKWHAHENKNRNSSFYAVRNVREETRRSTETMHNFLLGPGVDHRDSDGLNNRRSNLRRASALENGANKRKIATATSSFKGVCRPARNPKWVASICVKGNTKYLGSFVNELHAAEAYDRAAVEFFGEFAKLNFPA